MPIPMIEEHEGVKYPPVTFDPADCTLKDQIVNLLDLADQSDDSDDAVLMPSSFWKLLSSGRTQLTKVNYPLYGPQSHRRARSAHTRPPTYPPGTDRALCTANRTPYFFNSRA